MKLRFSPAALFLLSATLVFAAPLRAAVRAHPVLDGLTAISSGAAPGGVCLPSVSDDFPPSALALWKVDAGAGAGAADVENGGMAQPPDLSLSKAPFVPATGETVYAATTEYSTFRVIFIGTRPEDAVNPLPVSEFQLGGTLVPEPSTAILGLAGGMVMYRRRR